MKPRTMTTLSIRNSANRWSLRCGLPRKQQLPRTQAVLTIRGLLLIPPVLALAWLALSPAAQAVCREGCDTDNNDTFLGDDALLNNTDGFGNTAIGVDALESNTTGDDNTATGSGALDSNTTGSNNTANGQAALLFNNGDDNTATGVNALYSNTTGQNNTAYGAYALYGDYPNSFEFSTGSNNTGNGFEALYGK